MHGKLAEHQLSCIQLGGHRPIHGFDFSFILTNSHGSVRVGIQIGVECQICHETKSMQNMAHNGVTMIYNKIVQMKVSIKNQL